jgi:hypothetical protein
VLSFLLALVDNGSHDESFIYVHQALQSHPFVVDGHLDSFPDLAVVNSAAMNMNSYLYFMLTLIPSGVRPQVEQDLMEFYF